MIPLSSPVSGTSERRATLSSKWYFTSITAIFEPFSLPFQASFLGNESQKHSLTCRMNIFPTSNTAIYTERNLTMWKDGSCAAHSAEMEMQWYETPTGSTRYFPDTCSEHATLLVKPQHPAAVGSQLQWIRSQDKISACTKSRDSASFPSTNCKLTLALKNAGQSGWPVLYTK